MTEDEEVAWINSLGLKVTVADLRASYSSFQVKTVDHNQDVLWGDESDRLRNFYRLYKRTGYKPFLDQAKLWRDYYATTYSYWQNGGSNVVEKSHVYLMGLIDWYVDYKDQGTLDGINRLIDFIKTVSGSFVETRVTARCLMGLAYYHEKIGIRNAEVDAKIDEFLFGIENAKKGNGLLGCYMYVGTGWSVTGLPSGQDLRTLFPKNTSMGIVTGQNSYDIKGFYAAAVYQDVLLMHALNVVARVKKDSKWSNLSTSIATAWQPLMGPPFYDKSGNWGILSPYYVVVNAGEIQMFNYPGSSAAIYAGHFGPYAPDSTLRKAINQQTLLRGYKQLTKVTASELGGKPKLWPWQTADDGYFITQK